MQHTMGALKLVPSDGIRAAFTSSSSKSSRDTCSIYSSPSPTLSQHPPPQPSSPAVYRRSPYPSLPFVAAREPTDATPLLRAQNILYQKTLLLAASLFPTAPSSAALKVEYIGDGSYHRVTGFTVPAKVPRPHTADAARPSEVAYVVRVARDEVVDENVDMRRDIGVLQALQGRLDVCVPRVVAFDLTPENVLGAPYTIATRLRGGSLQDALDGGLSAEQQGSAVGQVVRLVEGLTGVTARYAGRVGEEDVEVAGEQVRGSRGVPVKSFSFPFDAASLASLADSSPLAIMLKLVDLWVKYELEYCPGEGNYAAWRKIKAILCSLQRHDLLGETFHLAHGDLAARNILVKVVDESSVEITGVVDWDFACFVPKFCAYHAPMELWDGDEDTALKSCPPSLIDAFKTTASDEYIRYALSKEARIGRKFWTVIRFGMLGEDMRWFASQNIWDWEKLHPEDDIRPTSIGLDHTLRRP